MSLFGPAPPLLDALRDPVSLVDAAMLCAQCRLRDDAQVRPEARDFMRAAALAAHGAPRATRAELEAATRAELEAEASAFVRAHVRSAGVSA